MRFWQVTHAHHNVSFLHILHVCMKHLNKLNKSINSKTAAMQRRRRLFSTATCTSQCKLRRSQIPGSRAANSRLYKWAGPSTMICLHYNSYRAEPRRSGPSPSPLGGPGPHDIWVGWSRSEAFTLHQTGLGTVPSPVKLYSVNGAYVSLAFRGLSGGIAYW